MIVNQAQRTLQPPLHGFGSPLGWTLAQDAIAPTQPGTASAGRIIGTLFVTVLGFGAVGLGAYIGAKESRKWAAGGAIIGNLAATGLLLLTTKIASQGNQP